MSYKFITVEQKERVALLTLNRPKQLNALNPELMQAHYSRGLLLDKLGDTQAGIEALHKAAALEPDNNFVNYDLGVLYSKAEKYEQSALYSQKALVNAEDFAEAYNNYGYALAHLGRHEEALAAINKSLELKPDSAAALDSKGFALQGLKRYEEALEEYGKALKIDPDCADAYVLLAESTDNHKEGLALFEQGLDFGRGFGGLLAGAEPVPMPETVSVETVSPPYGGNGR